MKENNNPLVDKKVEDLLKPRYKVIGLYPACPFKIGEVILPKYNSDDMRDIVDDAERFFSLNDKDLHGNGDLNIYPAVFKKLEWYEERKESEMPLYIKCIIDCRILKDTILKANWETYTTSKEIAHRGTNPDFWIDACYFYPATEKEFTEYLNQKQQ